MTAAFADPKTTAPTSVKNELRLKRVELVVRCQELARFLRGFGEDAWADWVEERIGEIRVAKPGSIGELLDGYTRFANLTDIFLCPEAGHQLAASDETRVNEQFLHMLAKVNELASEVLKIAAST